MSADKQQENLAGVIGPDVQAGGPLEGLANAKPPPLGASHRDAMWEAISTSWDAQLAQRNRARRRLTRIAAGFGIAATLAVGVFIGRWSADPDSAPVAMIASAAPGPSLPRQVALAEHLRDTETMLVLFADARWVDAQLTETGLADRARELAAASRMLISNSAAPDDELNALLQDLELLLLQIAQVSAAGDSTEFEIAQSGVRDADAIARMRLLRTTDARFDQI